MKIEYLLIKQKDDFCSSIEQLKNLLQSNSRLSISDSTITLSKFTFTYSITMQEVVSKKRQEIVFYLTVETDTDDAGISLEEFDSFLVRINENCGNHFMINTIWDDVSIHYAQILYPQIVEVENLLRKIIYRFMIKTAGSAWFDISAPEKFKEAIKNTAEKNENASMGTDQLYYADFIQLGAFFFQPYTTKPFSQDLIRELKKAATETPKDDDGKNLREKIDELLEIYEARSNWDRYFADKLQVEDLYSKWKKLYGYRNAVAHAKKLRKKDFDTSEELIEELKSAFMVSLDHIDDVEITEEESKAVQEVAKETVSKAKTTRIPGAYSGFSTFGAVSSSMPVVKVDGLVTSLTEMADYEQRIIDSIGEISEMTQNSLMISEKLGNALDISTRMPGLLQLEDTEDQLTRLTEPLTIELDHLENLDISGLGTIGISNTDIALVAKSITETPMGTLK